MFTTVASRSTPPAGCCAELGQSELFEQYIDYRYEHPGDDVMTDLLTAEYTDVDGVQRRLTREEALGYINLIAAAGNETTNRLIGWTTWLLAKHPDERRVVHEDRSLVNNTIEEVLRYESPSPVQARYVARDVECRGETIPEGSIMLLLNGSANRDERKYPDADIFDIHRGAAHLSFGHGLHFCMGSALARMQARVVLEEVGGGGDVGGFDDQKAGDLVLRIGDAGCGDAPGLAHHDVGRDDGSGVAPAPLLPRLQADLVDRLLLGFGPRAEGGEVFRLHGVDGDEARHGRAPDLVGCTS